MQTHKATRLAAFLALLALPACLDPQATMGPASALPVMRWDHHPEAEDWTRATLGALATDGRALRDLVPADIATWCPGYETATPRERDAFWAGLLSALAKHESTWNPEARGGGGRWLGLMQIAPSTARGYGCDLPEAGLFDGEANLACAVRIASVQVARDGMVAGDGRQGVGRDWAPMRSSQKRADMAAWTRAQPYCK